MKTKPDLSFWKLWNISFGFFGVQIAYALQSANISRIFATLGADPHSLSYFWILPPLMGIIVQPIVGSLSDKTWCRFGRRIPYLFIGATAAVLVMCLLPNAGSFGLTVSGAMVFGLVALMFLDTSINMAMQPFKMLVGDMVNEKQKAKAYSIQSFLCNAGSVAGYIFPFLFTFIGISNTAEKGVVPDSVIWSFYIGAAILILCVIYTTMKVREWNPKQYAEYNGAVINESESDKDSASWILLGRIPIPLELLNRRYRRNRMGHNRPYFRRVSRGRQLGWNPFRRASCRKRALGHCPSSIQKRQNGLRFKFGYRCDWLLHDSVPARPVYAIHSVPDGWRRMGSYACYAIRICNQRPARIRTYGRVFRPLQWNNLHSSNFCSSLRRWRPQFDWISPKQHDDCFRRIALSWSYMRFCN